VFHQSYLFDPDQFHSDLATQIIVDKAVDYTTLLKRVQNVIANATPSIQQLLDYLGYEPDWLEPSGQFDNSSKWYMCMLAQHLTPLLSLHDASGSITALRDYLPSEGWTHAEIRSLVYGDQLFTLVETSSNPQLIKEFRYGVSQYGGWLSKERSKSLLEQLNKIENEKYWIGGGYSKAIAMLSSGTSQHQAIYIISG
jgi:hypothetical protein